MEYKTKFEAPKNKIQLYSRQVFITDEVKDVVRYEEQDEKEYKKQLKKFFKGEDEDNT